MSVLYRQDGIIRLSPFMQSKPRLIAVQQARSDQHFLSETRDTTMSEPKIEEIIKGLVLKLDNGARNI